MLAVKFESFGSDGDRSSVLCLEEHSQKAIAEVVDVFLDKELRLVESFRWKIRPLNEPLKYLSIFFNCEPNTNKNQVLIIFIECAFPISVGSLDVLCLCNRMTSAINNSFLAIISDTVVGK